MTAKEMFEKLGYEKHVTMNVKSFIPYIAIMSLLQKLNLIYKIKLFTVRVLMKLWKLV
jgi:hypothetical protein